MSLPNRLIPYAEFQRVRAAPLAASERVALLADMCRLNTLAAVKRAGSGHLGSSFSAMDIVVWLYLEVLNTATIGWEDPGRDIYFSSKGHDVPGLYALLFALGALSEEQLLRLRRLGGLEGHPNVGVRGIEANSGSLGMGISKGKGMALGKRLRGLGGRVVVLVGDGELQEGQNYEALQSAAQQRVGSLTVIVDHNKVQTDRPVDEIVALGDLAAKFRTFGWQAARADGHDVAALQRAWDALQASGPGPKVLIADTIKGRGVSFMEHPAALAAGGGLYRWHSGAPDDASYAAAHAELVQRIEEQLARAGLAPLALRDMPRRDEAASSVSREYVAEGYSQALLELAARHPELVVLDGDLAADCRVRAFEEAYPERFIENGIAEQDMVSTAAGLARMGLLPVVNSFASFLAARANEQIYNAAGEHTRIIYACHFAGLIPAGPGKSHQSIRDISLFAALPNCVILEPCSAAEARLAVAYCVEEARENCMLRLVIGPSPRVIALPEDYRLVPGRGVALSEGDDAALFAYGPVMLHEALSAAEQLRARGFGLRVINMPWLNRADPDWLAEILAGVPAVYVLEDHAPAGGLSDRLLAVLVEHDLLANRRFETIAPLGFPACGTPAEVLEHHGLSGARLAARLQPAEGSPGPVPAGQAYTSESPQ